MTLHCHEKFHNNKILEIYPSHSVVPINLTLSLSYLNYFPEAI